MINNKKINIVAAVDINGLMGNGDKLPWHLPADLKYFKSLTLDQYMIMGRKTFDSIGKPLPGRTTIIITTDKNYVQKDCLVATSIDAALSLIPEDKEAYIVGGANVINQVIRYADKLYLTVINKEFTGDVYFPPFNEENWSVISDQSNYDEKKDIHYKFLVLENDLTNIVSDNPMYDDIQSVTDNGLNPISISEYNGEVEVKRTFYVPVGYPVIEKNKEVDKIINGYFVMPFSQFGDKYLTIKEWLYGKYNIYHTDSDGNFWTIKGIRILGFNLEKWLNYKTFNLGKTIANFKNDSELAIAHLISEYKSDVEFDENTGEVKINGNTQIPFQKQYWFPEK